MIKMGQQYLVEVEGKFFHCILARVSAHGVALIDLKTGNRMQEPTQVRNHNYISEEEFEEIRVGNKAQLIPS